jgi:hypothetical protein
LWPKPGHRRRSPHGAGPAPSSAYAQQAGAQALTKRAKGERVYAELSATGAPVSAGQLAAAAGLSTIYACALVAEFYARPRAAVQGNGRRPTVSVMAQGVSEIGDD